MPSVYFDYNATTPLDRQVHEAMVQFEERIFANPSSIHRPGVEARARLDEARERLAALWDCKPSELIFTSGATEANNLALFGAARSLRQRGRHLVISAIEHPSVLTPCQYLAQAEGFHVTLLNPLPSGRLDPAALEAALRQDTILVSVMAANNEIGVLQPVAEIGALCRERGILFHCDAAQWFGKMAVESIRAFNADLVSVCAHKFHGPKGIGVLFVRAGTPLAPLILGGSQEHDRRGGTENLTAIIGAVAAIERFTAPPVFRLNPVGSLVARLRTAAAAWPGVVPLGSDVPTLPNTAAFAVAGVDAAGLIAALDLEGIHASSGSACSAGASTPSHVLAALGWDPGAHALLRFSLGRDSTSQEVDFVVERTPVAIDRLRGHALSPQNL